jgi:hypothetical protein
LKCPENKVASSSIYLIGTGRNTFFNLNESTNTGPEMRAALYAYGDFFIEITFYTIVSCSGDRLILQKHDGGTMTVSHLNFVENSISSSLSLIYCSFNAVITISTSYFKGNSENGLCRRDLGTFTIAECFIQHSETIFSGSITIKQTYSDKFTTFPITNCDSNYFTKSILRKNNSLILFSKRDRMNKIIHSTKVFGPR